MAVGPSPWPGWPNMFDHVKVPCQLEGFTMYRKKLGPAPGECDRYSRRVNAKAAIPELINLFEHFEIRRVRITLVNGDQFIIDKERIDN